MLDSSRPSTPNCEVKNKGRPLQKTGENARPLPYLWLQGYLDGFKHSLQRHTMKLSNIYR